MLSQLWRIIYFKLCILYGPKWLQNAKNHLKHPLNLGTSTKADVKVWAYVV